MLLYECGLVKMFGGLKGKWQVVHVKHLQQFALLAPGFSALINGQGNFTSLNGQEIYLL